MPQAFAVITLPGGAADEREDGTSCTTRGFASLVHSVAS